MNDNPNFVIGETVAVKADGSYVFHDFIGKVKAMQGEYVIVEDQDGDCFSCEHNQLVAVLEY